MSKILASIKNLSEAKILINTDIDIIDLKDPSKGALGRLDKDDIEIIVNFVNKKKITSSTVGDLPNDEKLISKNVKEISETNVDFIKIGVYENNYIKTLSNIKSCKKLIAVFFADKFLPTIEEIRMNAMANFSAQQRTVTKNDYLIRTLSMPARFGRVAKAYITQDDQLSPLTTEPNRIPNPYIPIFRKSYRI